MTSTISDRQVVEIRVTEDEMNTLLAAKAKAAGIIAFDAETTHVGKDAWPDPTSGDRVEGYIITFRRDSV